MGWWWLRCNDGDVVDVDIKDEDDGDTHGDGDCDSEGDQDNDDKYDGDDDVAAAAADDDDWWFMWAWTDVSICYITWPRQDGLSYKNISIVLNEIRIPFCWLKL